MRYNGLDLLRGIAAFGIVGCHLVLSPRTAGGESATALCNFNVGLFAALSGFFMGGVGSIGGWGGYIKKRAARLLPTYLVWTCVYLVASAALDVVLGGKSGGEYASASYWASVLFKGNSSAHLWFLPCLFYAQIAAALAFGWLSKRWHGAVWIAIGGALAVFSASQDNWYGKYPIRLLAFLVTGYGLRLTVGASLEALRRYALPLMIFALGVLAAHVYVGGRLHGFIKDWIAVGPVIIAFASIGFKSERMKSLAAMLGATSMGVYLVHLLFTRALSVVIGKVCVAPYAANVVVADWVVAWVMAFCAVLVMRKIPVVKKVV